MATLIERLSTLATNIGTQLKATRTLLNDNATDLSALSTSAKTSLVAAINELVAARALLLQVFASGTFTASEVLAKVWVSKAFTLPAGLSGSYASLETSSTASATFVITKNGTSIGTITFSASGTSGTFTFSSAVSFAVGDYLSVTAPSTADTSAAGLSVTLKGSY